MQTLRQRLCSVILLCLFLPISFFLYPSIYSRVFRDPYPVWIDECMNRAARKSTIHQEITLLLVFLADSQGQLDSLLLFYYVPYYSKTPALVASSTLQVLRCNICSHDRQICRGYMPINIQACQIHPRNLLLDLHSVGQTTVFRRKGMQTLAVR